MSEILPERGIEFEIIKRLEKEGEPVSASRVRKLLVDEDYENIRNIVPESTYSFLTSEEGNEIREILRRKNSL